MQQYVVFLHEVLAEEKTGQSINPWYETVWLPWLQCLTWKTITLNFSLKIWNGRVELLKMYLIRYIMYLNDISDLWLRLPGSSHFVVLVYPFLINMIVYICILMKFEYTLTSLSRQKLLRKYFTNNLNSFDNIRYSFM